jgi:hypothetical protein
LPAPLAEADPDFARHSIRATAAAIRPHRSEFLIGTWITRCDSPEAGEFRPDFAKHWLR